MWPSRTPTSAVRAGAPVPSTTVPPRTIRSRSGVNAVKRERVEPVQALASVIGQLLVVLAELVDHARILRVVVREVGGPDVAIGANELRERTWCSLTGVEADPALPLEVLLG